MSQPQDTSDRERARIEGLIQSVPDFPKRGILFRDLMPVFSDAQALRWLCERLAEPFRAEPPAAVMAIEARGYMLGAPVALLLGSAFVPVRKPGKLPRKVHSVSYALEYGEGCLEIHEDALRPGQSVLIVDDLLATGGTAQAAAHLAERAGAKLVGYSFAVELSALEGRKRLLGAPVRSEISY